MAGLALLLAIVPAAWAVEPSAAGLWQKVEEGKPVAMITRADLLEFVAHRGQG